MANVGFKLGTQTALDALLDNPTNNIVAGAFYLTSDTSRLYFGKDASTLVPVNEGVITVDRVSDLNSVSAHSGAFYYATEENVLCVRSGDNWVQINAVVTNTALTQAVATTEGVAAVTTSLADSRGGEALTASFSVKGADGVTITSEGNVLTISGDPIALAVTGNENVATAAITSEGGVDEKFQIAGGDNVTVAVEADNKIVVSAADKYLTSVAVRARGVGEDSQPLPGFEVYGSYNDNSELAAATFQPVVSLKANEDTAETTANFLNGVASLPVYTAGQVDALITGIDDKLASELKGFNAMEYRGTVGTEGQITTLPTDEVKNGYAYLVSGTVEHEGATHKTGALAVATGTEGEDGYLTDIEWTFISGSTIDTTYAGKVQADGALAIAPSTGDQTPVASVNVVSGTDIVVDIPADNINGNTQVYTVKHATYEGTSYGDVSAEAPEAMGAAAAAYEIEAITGVSVSNGHITGVTTKKFTVTDTNISINSLDSAVSVAEADGNGKVVATVAQGLNYTTGAGEEVALAEDKKAKFSIASSSLAVAADGDNGIAVDLVWGSF